MADEEIDSNGSEPERAGPEKYAPRNRRRSLERISASSVEDEIHKLVRRSVAQSAPEPQEPDASADRTPGSLDLQIGRIAGASIEEIDRLIVELQNVREMIRNEGERTNRQVTGYINLNQAVVTAIKVIHETLPQWKNPPHKAVDDSTS
jgi:hypothetical protein